MNVLPSFVRSRLARLNMSHFALLPIIHDVWHDQWQQLAASSANGWLDYVTMSEVRRATLAIQLEL